MEPTFSLVNLFLLNLLICCLREWIPRQVSLGGVA